MALYFENRARRSELAQAFAVNVAEQEREARLDIADNLATCGAILRERDASSAPVG